MSTLRVLFAHASQRGWTVHQLDVETECLHGKLQEEIYMEQPAMFEVGEKVCLLKRSLYGLRQAGRVWFETLSNYLKSIGLTEFGADRCCFYVS